MESICRREANVLHFDDSDFLSETHLNESDSQPLGVDNQKLRSTIETPYVYLHEFTQSAWGVSVLFPSAQALSVDRH